MQYSVRSILILLALLASFMLLMRETFFRLESWQLEAIANLLMGPVTTSKGEIIDEVHLNPAKYGYALLKCDNSKTALIVYKGHSIVLCHADDVNDIGASPDGRLVVTASDDGTAKIWDSVTGSLIAVLRGHSGRVTHASFSSDGRFVITRGDQSDPTSRIWRKRVPSIEQKHSWILGATLMLLFLYLFMQSVFRDRKLFKTIGGTDHGNFELKAILKARKPGR